MAETNWGVILITYNQWNDPTSRLIGDPCRFHQGRFRDSSHLTSGLPVDELRTQIPSPSAKANTKCRKIVGEIVFDY